jgi:hypothetical protein
VFGYNITPYRELYIDVPHCLNRLPNDSTYSQMEVRDKSLSPRACKAEK